jgi:hypothetical protein
VLKANGFQLTAFGPSGKSVLTVPQNRRRRDRRRRHDRTPARVGIVSVAHALRLHYAKFL